VCEGDRAINPLTGGVRAAVRETSTHPSQNVSIHGAAVEIKNTGYSTQ
jgi:hypothetical protein